MRLHETYVSVALLSLLMGGCAASRAGAPQDSAAGVARAPGRVAADDSEEGLQDPGAADDPGRQTPGEASEPPSGRRRGPLAEDQEEPDDTGTPDDEQPGDSVVASRAPRAPAKRPYQDLSDAELRRRVARDPKSLDSMSVGYPYAGALFNGVQMPPGPRWTIRNRREAWGTQETVDYIRAAIDSVHRVYPNTGALYIGDLSDPDGGQLNRHKSHQSGRDVDLGFYYRNPKAPWYTVANHRTLDRGRTWALVRAMLAETDVKLILINTSVQRLLFEHALRAGEDRAWLERVFQYPRGNRGAIIQHAPGHHTHIHVRFYSPHAQELGRRAYKHLLARKLIRPPTWYVKHKARPGDSLGRMARRYGTSIRAIRRANGLRSNLIRAGRTYRIPRTGGVRMARGPVRVPPRREPPLTPPTLLAAARRPEAPAARSPEPRRAQPQATPPAPKVASAPAPQPSPAKPVVLAAAAPPAAASGAGTRSWPSLDLPTLQARTTMAAPTDQASASDRLADLAALALKAVASLPGSAGDAKPARAASSATASAGRSRHSAPVVAEREPVRRRKAAARKRGSRRSKRPSWRRYRVRSGDSLWRIAHRQRVTVAELRRWNSLRGDHLEPGQTLRLRRK